MTENDTECGRLREQAEQWERRCDQAYERFDAASNDAMQANLKLARLREQLDAARQAAAAAEPGVSIPPADCTNNCGLGPCDCSGVYRVTAWAIDVPALRAALGVEGDE